MMLSKMLLLSPAAGEVAAIACVSAAKSRREKAESRPNDDVPKVMVTGRDAHTGRAKTCFRWVSFTRLFFFAVALARSFKWFTSHFSVMVKKEASVSCFRK